MKRPADIRPEDIPEGSALTRSRRAVLAGSALAIGAAAAAAARAEPAPTASSPFDHDTAILRRHKTRVRFQDPDLDFTFAFVLGMGEIVGLSSGEIFNVAGDLKEDDPEGWMSAFDGLAERRRRRAAADLAKGERASAGQSYLAAAFAQRASLHFFDPETAAFPRRLAAMEESFGEAARLLRIPLRPIAIPFGVGALPGYYLEIDRRPRPTLVMIGGGDTFREDLFYFAGSPGWKRDYNVLMVDLPGQGKTPALGLPFQENPEAAVSAALDWLERNAAVKPRQIAIYGVSGGGYFTACAVAADPRIKAWIASTPIFDRAEFWRKSLAQAVGDTGAPSAGKLLSLKKYAWQFGAPDFAAVIAANTSGAALVDVQRIRCPSLFLVGENEAEELKRQSEVLRQTLGRNGVPCTLVEFKAEDGADAHCQVNNLRLAHAVVFDWLDRVFGRADASERLSGTSLI